MAQPSTGLTFLGLGVILHHIAMLTGGWSAARRDGSGAGGPWAPCTSHSGCPGVVQAVRVTTVLGSLCSAVAVTLAGMVWVSGARCTPQGIPRAVFGREISVPEVIAGAAAGAAFFITLGLLMWSYGVVIEMIACFFIIAGGYLCYQSQSSGETPRHNEMSRNQSQMSGRQVEAKPSSRIKGAGQSRHSRQDNPGASQSGHQPDLESWQYDNGPLEEDIFE